MVIDVKYGKDWRVRLEPIQFEEQIAPALPNNRVILQDDSIGSTQVILHDDDAGSRRNHEQLLVVEPMVDALNGCCQDMVIPDTCRLSNFEKSVPIFEETLQQLDKAISEDYVPPNRDPKYLVFKDALLGSSSADKTKDYLDTNAEFDKSKVDKFPQNVRTMSGDILHKYNVGLSRVKPNLRTWVKKCGRLMKSNLGKSKSKTGFKRESPRKTPVLSVENKAKLEENTKNFGVLLATHLGSAEVTRQLCQEQ